MSADADTRSVTEVRPGATQAGPAAGPRKDAFAARLRRDWPLLVMAMPMLVLVTAFWWVPALGNVIAFQDYNPFSGGILGSPIIGFTNFAQLFGDAQFIRAVVNTLGITAFQLVFYFPLPIALALLLNSVVSGRLRAFIQGVVYLPHFFSWVLVVAIFQQMFGGAGLLAQILRDHGHAGIDWMTNSDTFILLVTAQTVWKDAGWGTIVFLAALSTIDQNLYEAAAVDGARRWRRMWHITLPGLRPVIVLLLILRLGDALNVGFEQFMLQRGAVGSKVSEVFDTFVYWSGLRTGDFGYGAAAGLFKGLVGLVLILAANRVAHALGERGVYSRS
ncbi:ABC transporter permease [Microbispora bryophytorum]|uniref:Polysaccharide ABC transporter ATP-binding protein n=2 Tax=Microbispora bryophytorum TaxID=1460882 RepID=A0A8H9GUT8_9ACTN|nr:ABC transporter permease subunit [Microbispora bryophytorum]GGO02178.1 polysaccharide ABC transporter ATP-binding protein [Microbispora bryophytorum]